MFEKATARITTVSRVYLIIALFIALIFSLVLLIQVQMDTLTAIRAYVGGEGLWGKAQKDAVHSIEQYAVSHDEADYRAYLREIQVPLGDRKARIELQKDDPDIAVAQAGFVQGRNHPDDVESAVRFFRRFQHNAYMSKVIEHWTTGDRMIEELNGIAEALHKEITSGRNNPATIRSYLGRLDDINRKVTVEEDMFSSTLADASRWANDVARNLTYAIALLFVALGLGLSWPIITRIRTTEISLFESEERFRSIVEHVDDIIYTVEADGTFSSISPSCERMLGWRADEWMGRPFPLIVHPDDLPHMQELFLQAQAGKSLPIFQVRILTKSGGYLESEIMATPIHRGDSIVTLGVVRDITERKRAAQAIEESERKFRTILEVAVDGVLLADVQAHKFINGNRAICDMLGYQPEELYRVGVEDIHPPAALPEVLRQFEQILKGEISVARNLPVRRKDGSVFLADVSGAPMELAGRIVLVGIFHDVTERKQAEDEIRKLNEDLDAKVKQRTQQLLEAQDELLRKGKLAVLGQVAGSVGHELRNPLGVMSNAVYFLQTVLSDADETTREYLNIIKNEITSSERIVSDLLDSVRTKPPQAEAVGVAELIEQTLNKLSIPAAVTLKLDIPSTLPPLRVDALQIHQVLRNLISNGVEAMPQGGTLEIRAVADEAAKKITVSVRDSGVGMTAEQLGKLFQPLFTTKARGIGLGLVVVKNLTEANGGTVQVASEADKGTLFAVTLPAVEENGVSV